MSFHEKQAHTSPEPPYSDTFKGGGTTACGPEASSTDSAYELWDAALDRVGDGLLRGDTRSFPFPLGLLLICENAERGEEAVLSLLLGVEYGEGARRDGGGLEPLSRELALELENPTRPPIALIKPPP